MTPTQLHILQHSLGLDEYGQGSRYRNHYVIGVGCDGYEDCVALVELGLMENHTGRAMTGGMPCFTVTDAGIQAVRALSSNSPKQTQGQKRYREWLRADCGLKFGEWLKSRATP